MSRPQVGIRTKCALSVAVALGSVLFPSGLVGAALSAASTKQMARPALSEGVFATVNRINAIRSANGLATGRATTAYTVAVDKAARSRQDPGFGSVSAEVVGGYSLWGEIPYAPGDVTPSPSSIVNAWVDHDGWTRNTRSTWNVDCTSPTAPSCNGHRRAILSAPPVPGAQLLIDVAMHSITVTGAHELSVATLLIWQLPAHH